MTRSTAPLPVTKPVGGEPQPRSHPAAARIIPLNRSTMKGRGAERLSPSIKRALLLLLEDGELYAGGGKWLGTRGRSVRFDVVEAMYARLLIKIVVQSRHRRRQTAKLTEIGLHVARDLRRELSDLADYGAPRALPTISESAQHLIAEIV